MKSELFPPEAGADGATKMMLGRRCDSSSLCGSKGKGSWAHTLGGRLRFSINDDRNSLSQPGILCGPGELSPDRCLGLSVVFVCLKKPWEERAGMTRAEKMQVVCLSVTEASDGPAHALEGLDGSEQWCRSHQPTATVTAVTVIRVGTGVGQVIISVIIL